MKRGQEFAELVHRESLEKTSLLKNMQCFLMICPLTVGVERVKYWVSDQLVAIFVKLHHQKKVVNEI